MRREAAFNLPCFNLMFKQYSEELGIDFQDIYLQLSREDDDLIKRMVAASLHEAFAITKQDEDT